MLVYLDHLVTGSCNIDGDKKNGSVFIDSHDKVDDEKGDGAGSSIFTSNCDRYGNKKGSDANSGFFASDQWQ